MRTCAFTFLSSLFINPSRQFTTRQFPFDIKVVVRSIYIVSCYLYSRILNFSDPVVTIGSFTITRTSLGLLMHASQVAHVKARARAIIDGTLFVNAILRSWGATFYLARRWRWFYRAKCWEAANQLRITDLTITQRLLIFTLRKLLLKIKFLPLIRIISNKSTKRDRKI